MKKFTAYILMIDMGQYRRFHSYYLEENEARKAMKNIPYSSISTREVIIDNDEIHVIWESYKLPATE